MNIFTKLKDLLDKFIYSFSQHQEYSYRLNESLKFISHLDNSRKSYLEMLINSIYAFGFKTKKDELDIFCAIIDYLYFISEEELEVLNEGEKNAIVLAYALNSFREKSSVEKRSLIASPSLIEKLLNINEDISASITNLLNFQEQSIDSELELLSDVSMNEYEKEFIENLKLTRRKETNE